MMGECESQGDWGSVDKVIGECESQGDWGV